VAKIRIALAPAFAQTPPMLARVLSAAVNGIDAFPILSACPTVLRTRLN